MSSGGSLTVTQNMVGHDLGNSVRDKCGPGLQWENPGQGDSYELGAHLLCLKQQGFTLVFCFQAPQRMEIHQ